MPIDLTCICGEGYQFADHDEHKHFVCEVCKEQIVIPSANQNVPLNRSHSYRRNQAEDEEEDLTAMKVKFEDDKVIHRERNDHAQKHMEKAHEELEIEEEEIENRPIVAFDVSPALIRGVITVIIASLVLVYFIAFRLRFSYIFAIILFMGIGDVIMASTGNSSYRSRRKKARKKNSQE